MRFSVGNLTLSAGQVKNESNFNTEVLVDTLRRVLSKRKKNLYGRIAAKRNQKNIGLDNRSCYNSI